VRQNKRPSNSMVRRRIIERQASGGRDNRRQLSSSKTLEQGLELLQLIGLCAAISKDSTESIGDNIHWPDP